MERREIPFKKMNGLGNDFAIIDARTGPFRLSAAAAQAIARRGEGAGCDQVIVLEPSRAGDVFMRILNADGSEVSACGNASRCVAALISPELGRGRLTIETRAGLLNAEVAGDGLVTVDMGVPAFEWDRIPLSRPFSDTSALDVGFTLGKLVSQRTARLGQASLLPLGEGQDEALQPSIFTAQPLTLSLSLGEREPLPRSSQSAGIGSEASLDDGPALTRPSVVNVGNPHCIFWVEDADDFDLASIGRALEYDELFPERANISLAQVLSREALRLRVWERGAGLTQACGTAACAAAVCAARTGRTGRAVSVELPGGRLSINWREADDHILMTGPVEHEFAGILHFNGDGHLASVARVS
jgi:diaminopimelate epimerase